MKNYKKHFASFCIPGVFALLAVSCSVNHVHNNAFNYKVQVETPTDNCLVRNDGTKVPGKDISWNPGVLARKTISIDGKDFPRSEIKGYFMNGSYYGLFKNEYGRRVGKKDPYFNHAFDVYNNGCKE